ELHLYDAPGIPSSEYTTLYPNLTMKEGDSLYVSVTNLPNGTKVWLRMWGSIMVVP
ncbi:unnamed protein product, partial [marine sediment metagenome]